MELILPTFGPRSLAKDINEINQVVGWMGISNTIDAHAFLWEEGVVTDLGVVPGGYTGQARAINNFGRIAIGGHVQQVDSVVGRSFLWDGGQLTNMGVLPGFDHSVACDLNDLDQAVGLCSKLSNPNERIAFIWQDGVMTKLNDLVTMEGVFVSVATAINNAGQILGYGGANGGSAALLLTPINQSRADVDYDCTVGKNDLQLLLDVWGPCPGPTLPCLADLDGDGQVGVIDLLIVLASWSF